METIALGIYPSFQCLASNCPSTCCAGWGILVDEKDYRRFLQLEPLWLRKDVLSNIREKDGKYFFINREGGRCAMLDKDGLCRIQRNTTEKALCNTCRKYPRLVRKSEGVLYLSMAASCPVVAEYLFRSTVFWMKSCKKEIGRPSSTSIWEKAEIGEIPVLENVWAVYQKSRDRAEEIFGQDRKIDLLYGCFEKMADGVLDIVLQHREGNSLLSFFQVLGQDASDKVGQFIRDTHPEWKVLKENYMVYRLLSRKIEFPDEQAISCYRQASGELFLLRTIAFCAYAEGQRLTKERWAGLLCIVYRFCAHGKKVSKAFGGFLPSFFPEDCFWDYMLF
ncbi:MAG: hypothetical protein HFH69_08615 [Lachnospiraceae bacterium]|nr:hypothetical protein [Lachnospiraceae bacterium]